MTVAILGVGDRTPCQPDDPLCPTRPGRSLSRYTVGVAISKYAAAATAKCPAVSAKRVTPHTLRHSSRGALSKGVGFATTALWHGDGSTQTTHISARRSGAQGAGNRADRTARGARSTPPT